MNKKRLCYMLRSRYPETFGIRKKLQGLKVKRLYNYVLSQNVILECERDASKKKAAIKPYLIKWSKKLIPTIKEMEDILDNSPIYKNRLDKDDLRTDIMFCKLAYGFLPSEYIGFGLEDKSPEERKEYISDIDTNVFGYLVNNIRILQGYLDKGECAKHFNGLFKREFIIVKTVRDYQVFVNFVNKHPIFVEKKVFSGMGKGTRLVNINEIGMDKKDYFKMLVKGDKYLLEELVIQRTEMAKFNESSVNTVRCITFKTRNGVEVPYSFMRTGRKGAFVDNGGSGGLLIGIDVITGKLCTDGYDEYGSRYESHPDSGIVFKEYQIPKWMELVELCKGAAKKEREIGYLSWDLAYTENGWIVIEVNEVGQLIGPQIVLRKGIKSELKKYFQNMESVI